MDVSGYAAMDLKGLNFKDCAEYSVSNQKRTYSNELSLVKYLESLPDHYSSRP
jgi:hypothetical protein